MESVTTLMRLVMPLVVAGVLVMGVSGPVVAGFEEGAAAFERGDYETAYQEMLPLAKAGNVFAQFYVGAMYGAGDGVPQDYVLAHMWFNLAAAQGHENAVKGRDIIAKEMTPAGISKAQKMAREWKRKK